MPSRYRDAARLKAEILARTGAGEPLHRVCATPGAPSYDTVRTWAKADAAFGEALATARLQGSWRRLWTFDEARAAAFLARARAGEPVKSLCGQPGMPSRVEYMRWKVSQPPFAEAAFALLQRRNAQLGERGGARRRPFDPALADRIVVRLNKGAKLRDVLAADPELPGAVVLTRWRREQPELDRAIRAVHAARKRATAPVPQARIDAVADHIVQGGSLASFARRPGAPSKYVLRGWMRDPRFATAVTQACEHREDWYHDQIQLIAERMSGASARDLDRTMGPLKRQLVRLRRRPRPRSS